MASFRLRESAASDLFNIGLHGREHWGDARMRTYLAELDNAFQTIAAMPRIGRALDEVKPGVRRFNVGSHMILYKLTEAGDVDVIRILHERMDYESHLDEVDDDDE